MEHECNQETRIARNEEDIAKIEKEGKDGRAELWTAMDKLKTVIMYRLPLWATFLIAALSSACTGLIVRTFS